VTVHQKTGKVIDDDGSKHEQNIYRLSPGIEEKAGKEQKYVHISVFMKDPAADEYHGQEDHYKNERAEKHISPMLKGFKKLPAYKHTQTVYYTIFSVF
jgi:hypothetical protein